MVSPQVAANGVGGRVHWSALRGSPAGRSVYTTSANNATLALPAHGLTPLLHTKKSTVLVGIPLADPPDPSHHTDSPPMDPVEGVQFAAELKPEAA